MKRVLLLVMFCLSVAGGELPDIRQLVNARTDDPALLFFEGDVPAFHLTEGAAARPYSVTVKDYAGNTVYSGECRNGSLNLPPLPCGYFRLSLSGVSGELGFGVLKPRRDSRIREKRPSPYAVDVAIYSGFSYRGDPLAGVEILAGICDKLGVGFVRNRLVWSSLEKDSGGNKLQGYRTVARILEGHGISSSVTFHDAPAGTKRDAAQALPSDLSAVYEFCRDISAAIPEVCAWEFWNEQDEYKAWEFAAAQKAAYLGFKAGNPRAQVTPGSFVLIPFTNESRNLFRNGIGMYFDLFNYHLYSPLRSYPAINRNVRELLSSFHLASKPVWITENGTYADGNSEVAKSVLSDVPAQSARQEMIWAEFVPKSQILSQSEGVDRTFTFILRRKQEGARQWGLLHPDLTAKPGAVTLAVLNYELGDAVFEGEFPAPRGFRAFLFRQPDGTRTLAVWKVSLLDTSPEKFLPGNYGETIERGELFFDDSGRLLAARPSVAAKKGAVDLSRITMSNAFGASVPVERGESCLIFPVENLVGYIDGLTGLVPPEAAVSSVLPADVEASEAGDKTIVLQAEVLNTPGKLRLTVYNFDRQTKDARIIASRDVKDLPPRIELPGMGKASCEVSVESGSARELEFVVESDCGKSSPLLIPCSELGMFTERSVPELLNPALWSGNSSGEMAIGLDPTQKELIFRSIYAPGTDRWSYPVFHPRAAGIDLTDAYGVAFEMKEEKPASANAPKTGTHLCWIDGKRYRIPSSYDKWTECRVLFPNHPEKIEAISIGLNPRCDDLTFRLRNFRVLR